MTEKKKSSLPSAAILLGTMGVAIRPEGNWCTVELIALSIFLATLHSINILYKVYKTRFAPVYHRIGWLMVILLLPLLGSFLFQLKYGNINGYL